MAKLIIMQGLPGSGKSTKAKEIVSQGNTVRINKDLLRTMLHFDKFTGRNEGLTRDASREVARMFLKKGISVVVDDTNFNDKTLQGWKDLAAESVAKIEYVRMKTDVHECVMRDSLRQKPVGEHVIKKMALQHLEWLKGEKVVVCDLDGTIADITHRLQYGKGDTKDWAKFFSLIPNDIPRREIIDQVSNVANNEQAFVIFVSARPENYRKETIEWLDKALENVILGRGRQLLIMRDSNDKRPDTEVKKDIYEKYLKGLTVVSVFDDRPSVIRMWRELGLNVIDVGHGVEF